VHVRRAVTAVLLVFVLALAGAACGGGGDGGNAGGSGDTSGTFGGGQEGDLVGVIVDVTGTPELVERFTLKSDDGKKQVIYLDPAIDYGLRPGVLQEHQQAQNPIRVATEDRGGKLYATVILNA
jgi:hypothetical protein